MTRQRADLVLVAQGLATSRARAQAEIAAGHVSCAGRVIAKANEMLDPDAALVVTDACPYVSRGGLKLAHALDAFGIHPAGLTVLDLGASTGGFCDCLLQRGAAKIYAVDVGHGQLHEKIRNDPRVVNLEGTDARDLAPTLFAEAVPLVTADLSFIALEKVLGSALDLAAPGADLIALVKPQFEVGRANIGKGGIVRDAGARQAALSRVKAWIGARSGWQVAGETASPISGGDGNEEYLIAARKTKE